MNEYFHVFPTWSFTRDFKLEIYCTSSRQSQALVSNPKIEVRDGTYGFKPKYNLKDKKALLRLLDKHDQLGLGGVLLEDVEEGLPNSAKAIKVIYNKYDKRDTHLCQRLNDEGTLW